MEGCHEHVVGGVDGGVEGEQHFHHFHETNSTSYIQGFLSCCGIFIISYILSTQKIKRGGEGEREREKRIHISIGVGKDVPESIVVPSVNSPYHAPIS